MPYFLAGKPHAKGKSLSAGDTLFPSNFLDLSTAEERSSLGITEESDAPSTAPSETRLAGGNFETSVPTVTKSPTQGSSVLTDNEFPDLDATTKSYIEALGQDFFKENIAPRLAGSRFGVEKEGITYRKPSNLKGGVLSYNRQDKIEPPAPLPQAPAAQTPAAQTPSAAATFTPPPGAAPKIDYPTDTKPNISSPSEEDKPNQAYVHAPSIIEQARTRNPISTSYGINKSYFGGEDLEAAREAGHSDADIKKYLDANPSLLREQNVPGGGGVYDQLNPAFHQYSNKPDPIPDYTSNLSDQQPFRNAPEPSANQGERKPISIDYGISSNYFGGEDLEAAKEAGYSDREIFDYLNLATNLLREQNAPGGGGIYDQLKAKVG